MHILLSGDNQIKASLVALRKPWEFRVLQRDLNDSWDENMASLPALQLTYGYISKAENILHTDLPIALPSCSLHTGKIILPSSTRKSVFSTEKNRLQSSPVFE